MPKEPSKKAVKKTAAKKAVAKKAAAKKAVVKEAVAKKAAVKAAAPTKATEPVVKKAVPRKTATKKVVTKKAVAKPVVTTTVIAKIDAGFGNELFIRGSGAGLSWETGTLMNNVASDEWVWQATDVEGELEFKILLNDDVWSEGQNSVVFAGATLVLEPVF
jgi:hypothetical protein